MPKLKWIHRGLTFYFGFQLLLMKRGGQIIYAGAIGHRSRKVIEYFQVSSNFIYYLLWLSNMSQIHNNLIG